jgi:uncharacterized protein
MKNIEEIKKILNKNKIQFQKNYKVKEIGIFGSYIKSEQTKKSDLDILINPMTMLTGSIFSGTIHR